jgi:hypothetical protein
MTNTRMQLGAVMLVALFLGGGARADDKKAPQPAVVLVANLREAGEDCGCGRMIHLVREAAKRGVAVREIDPAKEPSAGRAYGLTVVPAVAFLDAEGHVSRRFAGEDADFKALGDALAALKPSAPTKNAK